MILANHGIVSSSGGFTPTTLNVGIAHVINAENTYISSTSGIAGSGIGGMSFGTGLIGQCFTSNGINSYVSYNTASLNFTNSFSASFWVKTTTLQVGTNGLISSYDYSSSNYGYYIGLNTTNKIELFWNNTTDNLYVSTNSIIQNQWNHIVVIWDKINTNWKVYVNNVLDINTTVASANNIRYLGSEKSNICSIYNDAANSLNGNIDAISMWNKTLTNAEVNELYNGGSGKQYPY